MRGSLAYALEGVWHERWQPKRPSALATEDLGAIEELCHRRLDLASAIHSDVLAA